MEALRMVGKRVLFHLSNSFFDAQVFGGAELGTLVVIKALRSHGATPFVVMHGRGYFAELLEREDIPFEVIPLSERLDGLSRNRSLLKDVFQVWNGISRM